MGFLPSSAAASIYVKYGSTSYGVVCRSVTRRGIRPATFDLQRLVEVEKGSAECFVLCDSSALCTQRGIVKSLLVFKSRSTKGKSSPTGYWN